MTTQWISVAEPVPAESYGGWSSHNFRQRFGPGMLFNSSATKLRLVLQGPHVVRTSGLPTEEPCTISDFFIGFPGVGDYDFDGNQVRVTFGGSNGVILGIGGGEVISDEITLAYDGSQALIYEAMISGTSLMRLSSSMLYGSGVFRSGGTCGATIPSGYANSGVGLTAVKRIEGLISVAPKVLNAGPLPDALSYSATDNYQTKLFVDHAWRQASAVNDGLQIAVFGDSNTATSSVRLMHTNAENYGIQGLGFAGLNYGLRQGFYSSLSHSTATVLFVPFNDIPGITSAAQLNAMQMNFAAILAHFTGPMVLVPIMPTSDATYNGWINQFNAWLTSSYASRAGTTILGISQFKDGAGMALSGVLRSGDPVHWSDSTKLTLAGLVATALVGL